MFGMKAGVADEPAGDREFAILDDYGIEPAIFGRFRKVMPGTRRPFLIHPDEFQIIRTNGGLEFRFVLPAGAYATSVLREFQK